MRPPDQIPNRQRPTPDIGGCVYLWTGRNYSEKTVVSIHAWKNAFTLRDGIGEIQVGGDDVIGVEQFREEQREEARQRYAEIIKWWEAGTRKSKDMAEVTGLTPRAIGQMIAAAKRWGLLVEDPKP